MSSLKRYRSKSVPNFSDNFRDKNYWCTYKLKLNRSLSDRLLVQVTVDDEFDLPDYGLSGTELDVLS